MESARDLGRIVDPSEYTPAIINAIIDLKDRMECAFICHSDEDIIAFDSGDSIYILANPVLGQEPVYDEFGNIERYIPMRNITIIYPHDWLEAKQDENGTKLIFTVKTRLRVLKPELCIRLECVKPTP